MEISKKMDEFLLAMGGRTLSSLGKLGQTFLHLRHSLFYRGGTHFPPFLYGAFDYLMLLHCHTQILTFISSVGSNAHDFKSAAEQINDIITPFSWLKAEHVKLYSKDGKSTDSTALQCLRSNDLGGFCDKVLEDGSLVAYGIVHSELKSYYYVSSITNYLNSQFEWTRWRKKFGQLCSIGKVSDRPFRICISLINRHFRFGKFPNNFLKGKDHMGNSTSMYDELFQIEKVSLRRNANGEWSLQDVLSATITKKAPLSFPLSYNI